MLHPTTLPRYYTGDDIDLFSEGFMSIAQAADHLKIHRSTLHRAMKRAELPFCKVGGATRIPIRALRIWTEKY